MMGYMLGGLLFFISISCLHVTEAEIDKEGVDKLIEDEITRNLADDLFQSIEKKFYVDLQNSVDMVLTKIKLLLQNGTTHVQDELKDLQTQMSALRDGSENGVNSCLVSMENATSSLAESALHQMVICGYALIGHDPSHAVKEVIILKNMIKDRLRPLQDHKEEIYGLLKACGHDHDSLKKVIKCVISKSPVIKSAMMDVTNKIVEGVVTLTKLMAHGAMHEACLIEVVSAITKKSFTVIDNIRTCVLGNVAGSDNVVETFVIDEQTKKYIEDNNATVLDVQNDKINDDASDASLEIDDKELNSTEILRRKDGTTNKEKKDGVEDIDHVIKNMLKDKNLLDKKSKKKLLKMRRQLRAFEKEIQQNVKSKSLVAN